MSENRPKILILSSYDVGGASIAAIRMHMALYEAGEDSRLMSLHVSQDNIPQHFRFSPAADSVNRIKLKWKKRNEHQLKTALQLPPGVSLSGEFSMPVAAFDVTQSDHWGWADVVIIHWVNEWIQLETLVENAGSKPLIWVMHDMHAFSGGCHYAHGCSGFQTDCQHCPMLKGSNFPELAHRFWKNKWNAIQNWKPRLTIIAPSQWMVNESKKSSLFCGLMHRHIFNSLDTSIFCQRELEACRKVLGIPLNKKVLLCVIQSLEDRRKGFALLLEALAMVEESENLILCTVGKARHLPENLPFEHFHLGSIADERMMAIIYNTADLLVHPALEDNLPNVVVEALACGLPCTGFAIGGMPEMVEDGVNGYLSTELSPLALANTIETSMLFKWNRSEIARMAHQKFALSVQAEKMLDLIAEVIQR